MLLYATLLFFLLGANDAISIDSKPPTHSLEDAAMDSDSETRDDTSSDSSYETSEYIKTTEYSASGQDYAMRGQDYMNAPKQLKTKSSHHRLYLVETKD